MGRTRGGSGAKNGRDPNPKSLGVKRYAGEEQNSILEQML